MASDSRNEGVNSSQNPSSSVRNIIQSIKTTPVDKECRPKSTHTLKSSSPAKISKDLPKVIFAPHIRVSEVDRRRLTFGSFGIESDEPSVSQQQVELVNNPVHSPGPVSPGSRTTSEPQSTDRLETHIDNYTNFGHISPFSETHDFMQHDVFSSQFPATATSVPMAQQEAGSVYSYARYGNLTPPYGRLLSPGYSPTATATTVPIMQQEANSAYPYARYADLTPPYGRLLSPVYSPTATATATTIPLMQQEASSVYPYVRYNNLTQSYGRLLSPVYSPATATATTIPMMQQEASSVYPHVRYADLTPLYGQLLSPVYSPATATATTIPMAQQEAGSVYPYVRYADLTPPYGQLLSPLYSPTGSSGSGGAASAYANSNRQYDYSTHGIQDFRGMNPRDRTHEVASYYNIGAGQLSGGTMDTGRGSVSSYMQFAGLRLYRLPSYYVGFGGYQRQPRPRPRLRRTGDFT